MTVLAQESGRLSDRDLTCPDREQHFLLRDVSWEGYVAIGAALADRPGLRMTYDRGSLELMTTSRKHELYKKHLARFIEIIAEELNRPFDTAGNMTFQKDTVARGLEADDCFWFEHEAAMRGKLTWDANTDPPPDLGLEIEVSRSALNRMGIYAALRVPEVWCFDSQTLKVHRLQVNGSYQQQAASEVFPEVPVQELVRFLNLAETTDTLGVIRAFRQWVQGLKA